jgi:hypothetical protein
MAEKSTRNGIYMCDQKDKTYDTNILNDYPAQVMVTSVKLSKW